ncbi:MAG: hypothetical protein H7325_10040, partial [Pedobacter sp.]|nr:hypothetical protein [Pedobacter sp.]
MKKLLVFISTAAVHFAASAQQEVYIIPKPVSLKVNTGNFVINPQTVIELDGKKSILKPAVQFLNAYLNEIAG